MAAGAAARRGRSPARTYAYEDEDQSLVSLRPGVRVRHPTFGVGTVISVEQQHDDVKLTVSSRTWARRSCWRGSRSWRSM